VTVNEPRVSLLLLGIALGTLLAGVLAGCGSEAPDPQPGTEPEVSPEASGPATRRVVEGCDPGAEAQKYVDLVDARALALLKWTGMREAAAKLKVPVYVVRIEDAAVGVRFLDFPMREQYLHLWLQSGHIEAGPENVFRLQPCSATLEPWPAP